MFYHLHLYLQDYISGLRVIKYITFRAGSSAVLAFLICVIVGPIVIRKMLAIGIVDEVREDGPATHQKKQITPTMGGLIILPAVIIPTLLFSRLDLPHVWIAIIATSWMGCIGFLDDYLKKKKSKKGLAARYKLIGQVSLGALLGMYIYFFPNHFSEQFADSLFLSTVPFFKNLMLNFAPFGLWFIFIIMTSIVVTGTSNSVNLSDGLDGLAAGLVAIVTVGLALLAWATGNVVYAEYLNIIYLPGSGELAVFCAAVVGSVMGFLWFNTAPAEIYMGDTGSLALGSGIAAVAIVIKKELFLFILGGIFVVESLSVLIQKFYFKQTRRKYGVGKRFFLMAPIHHHFELSGWAETKVVVRFWIVGMILLFLTLISFKIR